MVSYIALVSSDAKIVYGFRTIFAPVCKVRVFTDYIVLQKALAERAFDFVFIDFCMAQSLSDVLADVLFSHPVSRCFFISALAHPAMLKGRVVLRFPQDMLLFLKTDAAHDDGLTDEQNAILSQIVGISPTVKTLKKQILTAARTDIPVLITGETGVGKGLVAKTIHLLSARGNREWVPVNVTENPDGLEASALFGTVRGAFTDAQNRAGYFERAQNSTLFLDEIGELKRDVQAKLLYAVEEGTFRSVGSDVERHTNARLVFATNADLKKRMVQGLFREDLYYRISRLRIAIPPLRERTEDVIPLAKTFAARLGKTLSDSAQTLLTTFTWNGNVRQLANCIERASASCASDCITMEYLSQD